MGFPSEVMLTCNPSPSLPPPRKLLQLIAKSQLTSLSGVAQKNYFNILDKIVQKGKARTDIFNDLSLRNLVQGDWIFFHLPPVLMISNNLMGSGWPLGT